MRGKLMKQFTALGMVILMVVCAALFSMLHYVNAYSLKISGQLQRNNHQQVLYRLEEYFDAIEKAAYSMCYAPTTQQYILTEDMELHLDLTTDMLSIYSSTYLLLDSLIGIALFTPEGDYVASSSQNIFHSNGLPEPWHSVYSNQYTDLYKNGEGPQIERDCFGMVPPMYSLYSFSRLIDKRIGTAVLSFSTAYLNKLITSGNLTSEYLLVLSDRNGRLLASRFPEAASYFTNQRWVTSPPAAHEETRLSQCGWTLHSFMPKSVISVDIRPLITMTYLTSGVFLLLVITLLLQLNFSILRPLFRFGRFMNHVAETPAVTPFAFKRNNEIGDLIQIFNNMLEAMESKNRQLLRSETQAYEAELSRKQMAIHSYRNQINPHFLYNTLDCIRGIALYHEADEIAKISESLSTMFRYAVKGGDFATVQQECSHVQEYALIIGYRFINRIHISVNVQQDAEVLQVLKLSMQPLVENAVFHGLERKRGEGNIQLSVTCDE